MINKEVRPISFVKPKFGWLALSNTLLSTLQYSTLHPPAKAQNQLILLHSKKLKAFCDSNIF